MALNRKHTTPDFADFQRYHANEMSATERHVFEKKLLDNPFIADAYEGYLSMLSNAGLDRNRISSELKGALQKRIQPRRRRISPLWTSATAAGIVVALGAGWLIFSNENPASILEPHRTHKSSDSISQLPIGIPDIKPEKTQAKISQRPTALPVEKPVKKTDQITPKGNESETNSKSIFSSETALSESVPKKKALSTKMPDGAPQEAQIKAVMIRGLANPAESRAAAPPSLQIPRLITGRIVDEKGNGIPSAAISYGPSNATQTTLTNESGSFQISSRPGDSLLLSFLGYKTKYVVITQPNLENILLEADPKALDEVIVVGYGTQKKSFYIGAAVKKDPTDHTLAPTREASPVYGWTYYSNYLTENTSGHTIEGTIIVSFTVGRNGKLRNIDARGPQNLRKKAIDLVTMGSEWRPAYKNNKPIASKREVRLQFRK